MIKLNMSSSNSSMLTSYREMMKMMFSRFDSVII